jgi:hypothetical protein
MEPISTKPSFDLLIPNWEKVSNREVLPYYRPYEPSSVTYYVNKQGFRCEDLTKDHTGTHILFSGCSVTFGEGVDYDKTWSYKLYKELNARMQTSGYFNVSVPGASITDIIINTIKYCKEFGNPEYIFLSFPNIERDYKYSIQDNKELIIKKIFDYYLMLDQYCKSNNIKLFSFSWAYGVFRSNVFKIDEFLFKYFDSYYQVDAQKFKIDMFVSSASEKDFFAEDGHHPGNSAHDAWHTFLFEKYLGAKK